MNLQERTKSAAKRTVDKVKNKASKWARAPHLPSWRQVLIALGHAAIVVSGWTLTSFTNSFQVMVGAGLAGTLSFITLIICMSFGVDKAREQERKEERKRRRR